MGPGISSEETDQAFDNIEIDFGFDNIPNTRAEISKLWQKSNSKPKKKEESKSMKKKSQMEGGGTEEDKGEQENDIMKAEENETEEAQNDDLTRIEFLHLMKSDQNFLFDMLFEIDFEKVNVEKLGIDHKQLRNILMSNDLLMGATSLPNKINCEKYIVEHPPKTSNRYSAKELTSIVHYLIDNYILPCIDQENEDENKKLPEDELAEELEKNCNLEDNQ